MKKSLLILFCAALFTSAQAQWSKSMETPTKASFANTPSAIAVMPTGETYVSGSLSKEDVSFGNTLLDFSNVGDSFLFKYSATGEPVWANLINCEESQITAVTYDNSGNIYAAGIFRGEATFKGQGNTQQSATSNSYYDMLSEATVFIKSGFIAKYSPTGELTKLETFLPEQSDLPAESFMALIVDASFTIQNLQFVNGKLYASVLYAGKTLKNGISFLGKAYDSEGMASDLFSGCVISLTTDLVLEAKIADLTPVTEGANSLFNVTESKVYANNNHVYAIFAAMANQTLTVGSNSENISTPFENENDIYSRAYIIADINPNGTLNKKNVYQSTKVSIVDIQNTIGGISEKDGKIIVTGLFNQNLPFNNSLVCNGKFDSYVAKINPSDLSVESAIQGNINTPAIDVTKNEYMTVYPMSTAFSSNKIYTTVNYRLALKPIDKIVFTYASYFITYDYSNNTVTPGQQAENVNKNGVGAYDNKVSTATLNITNREFDEGTFVVAQTIDGESSAISSTTNDKTAIVAYPNPVVNILKFSETCDVMIFNAQGAMIMQASAVNSISVDNLPTGMYQAVAKSDKGSANITFIKK